MALNEGRKIILCDLNYGEGGSYQKLAEERLEEYALPLLDLLRKCQKGA
jgi:hypothetical protein